MGILERDTFESIIELFVKKKSREGVVVETKGQRDMTD